MNDLLKNLVIRFKARKYQSSATCAFCRASGFAPDMIRHGIHGWYCNEECKLKAWLSEQL